MCKFGRALPDPAPYLEKNRSHYHQHNRSPDAKPNRHLNAIAVPVHIELPRLIGKPRGKAANNNQNDKGSDCTGHALARPTNGHGLGAEIIECEFGVQAPLRTTQPSINFDRLSGEN
jgi:hypothetical protein